MLDSLRNPEHCHKLPAEAIRPSGSSLDQIAAITMMPRARATGPGVGVPDASQLLPAGPVTVHPVCMA